MPSKLPGTIGTDSHEPLIDSGTSARTSHQPPGINENISSLYGMSGKSEKEILNDWTNIALTKYPSTITGFHASGVIHPVRIIGPEGQQKIVKKIFKLLTFSYYGVKMLEGIANGGGRLDIVYKRNFFPAASTARKDPGSLVNRGTTIYGDLTNGSTYPRFGTALVAAKVDNSKFKHLLPADSKTNNSFKQITPEMTLIHELFHAWQNTGKSPSTSDNYFHRTNYYTYPQDPHRKTEAHALRYTNQIRIDFGLGYIRTQYKTLGSTNIDTVRDALIRWKARKSIPT